MAPGLLGAAAAVLAAVASLAAHVALNCPVQPVPSTPRPPTPPPNNLLQRLEKLGEGALDAPEDVYVDAAAGGVLYTATRDGWLQRMHPNNGSWERWRFVGGTGLLGVAPSADGTMLVCDANKALRGIKYRLPGASCFFGTNNSSIGEEVVTMATGLLAAAVLAAVASLAAHVALNCPVQPVPSTPRPPTPPPNNLLQRLEKLGEGALDAPEDVYVDAAAGGTLYTATRDGWLQRMHPNNGSWERWRFVGGTGLLGVAPSADGTMLVCDADKGLLRVGEEGVTLLASEVDGSTIRFADAAIEASDGTVYFSDVSTRFGFDRWFYDFLESHATGRLLRYDPRNGETSVVLDRLSCANGVALLRDEAFVIVCETWRFSCLKVWLKGEKAGKAETFVDLPGAPDNIRLGSDGHFWIALHLSSPWLDFITRWTFTKRVVASFPVLLKWSKATIKGAMVAQVSEDGNIVRVLDDSEGKVINSVTSVTEFNGDIFLGSLSTNFVGKLSLAQVTQQEQGAVSS